MYNMGIQIDMDSWYDIVRSYDDPKSKDHGTLSQKNACFLLIYLAFGADYSGGIAKYFSESLDIMKDCPRILTNGNKIGSVLKRMNQDKLVTLLKEVTIKAGTRKYYILNPEIIQSPIKDSTTYIKRDGSPFKIPLVTIEGFLGWLGLKEAGIIDKENQEQFDEQARHERHKLANIIFRALFFSGPVDYFRFLDFIKDEAKKWDLQREASIQQPPLNNLISDYVSEIDSGEYMLRKFTYVKGFV
jgi:hypothetical protein